jgi:hypothetical protein
MKMPSFFTVMQTLRKNINAVWMIEKSNVSLATSFKDVTEEGINYFGSIYKVEGRATIAEILILSTFFPVL